MNNTNTAAQPLTDWIPCTTPPMRDGVYEITMFPDFDETGAIRKTYQAGAWFGFPGINEEPGHFYWRGVRRWVLVVRGDPVLGADAYVQKRTPTSTFWNFHLLKAKDFDAEAKAIAYRDKGRHSINHWIEAVLP